MDERATTSAGGDVGNGENARRRDFYRLEANHSSASVFEDVEMAHDEVWDIRPYRVLIVHF
jgi:hypothetical protein